MEVNGYLQMSAYQLLNILFVCVQQDRNSYRFGTIWEWVHDNFHFWV